MGNHYHLAIEISKANLSEGMRDLNLHYAVLFNRIHGKVGHLFQDRFDSRIVVDDNYMMELSRYIALNPVRAGLVEDPSSWPWSSYQDLLTDQGIATNKLILSLFSNRHDVAKALYLKFISNGVDKSFPWNDVRDYLLGKRQSRRPGLSDVFMGECCKGEKMAEAYNLHGYKLREIAEFLGLSISHVHRSIKANTRPIGEETG